MSNIDSDLIRGNIDTIILKTMLENDMYGLDIIKEVETRSNGTYILKQPTLYSCLKRLENQELISSYWLDSDIGGRRHYYKLTDKGRETLTKKQEEWAKSKFIIDNLLSDFNYEEYRLVKKDDYDRIIEGKTFDYTPTQPTEQPQANKNEDSQSDEPEDNSFDTFEPTDTLDNNPAVLEDLYDDFAYHEENNLSEPNNYNIAEDAEIEENEIDDTEVEDEIEENEIDDTEVEDDIEKNEIDDTEVENDIEEHKMPSIEEISDADDEEMIESSTTSSPASDLSTPSSTRHYFVDNFDDEEDTPIENNTIVPDADQTTQESNMLSRLRSQDDEEINTYYGDKKSYINHLNITDNTTTIQQDMLTDEAYSSEKIDETINEFNQAIEELSKFNETNFNDDNNADELEEAEVLDSKTYMQIEEDIIPETYDFDDIHEDIEDENLLSLTSSIEFDDEFTRELDELKTNSNSGFFNSYDNPEYDTTEANKSTYLSKSDYDDDQTSADADFEYFNDTNSDTFDFSTADIQTDNLDDNLYSNVEENEFEHETNKEENPIDYNSNTTQSSVFDYKMVDDIISSNANNYQAQYTETENSSFVSFKPTYTSQNYKQKLSNLSAYSKISEDEPAKATINHEALEKAKDIETLKCEFEKEGIKVKEFRKYNSCEQCERTYILSNKMKFINSLILLFGYVFLLSAVYIILNNTSFKDNFGFSFKYFLYGFIPFGIYALYHTVMYLINPYKKIPAKLAPRILIFISLIITIQLLLITYCINLQSGFYSFTQEQYNHLLWVIPTIISFAPIVCNISYITLFYSKNFNV